MELFKLLGTIAVSNDEAIKALDETGEKGEATESKLSKAFTNIGGAAVKVGKVLATSVAAGAAAFGTLTVKAMNAAGELEQNMGGCEAVFKESAEQMQETARNAFTNMGLSMSDFLGNANKMGALFQGAGFDIEASADMSANAMQRAADVASIMGIDVNSAMEAVAGMAKGNFTMMDNLGVAINDTTLQIYAQEKGLGKLETTQDKVNAAYQLFMEKSEYAAGNYKKENETFAGAMTTAKAALDNFLSGAGTAEQLADAFVGAADVIIVKLNDLFPKLVDGIQQLIEKLMPELPRLLQSVLPGIIQGALSLVTGLIEALPMILEILIAQIPMIITEIGKAIVKMVPVLIETAKEIGLQIMESINGGLNSYQGDTFSGLIQAFFTLQTVVSEVFENHIKPLFQDFVLMLQELWTNNSDILNKLGELFSYIFTFVGDLFGWFVGIVSSCMDNIKTVFQSAFDIIGGIVDFFIALFKGDWQGMWDAVVSILTSAVALVQNWFTLMQEFIASIMNSIWSKIGEIWESIKLSVSTKIESIVSTVKTKFQNILDGIKEKMELAKTAVSDAIEKIKGFFDFEWHLPELKLPHIRIDGEWDLKEGKFPSFGVEWYAKGAVLNKPTIFGMNGMNAMVGGEAGAEAVAPIDVLQGYVAQAVASQNAGLVEVLLQILDALLNMREGMKEDFVEALENMRFELNNREFGRLVKAVR
jgi:phage-related protein